MWLSNYCVSLLSPLLDPPPDYMPPFHGHVPADPSIECMYSVVVERKIQPDISALHWEDKVCKYLNLPGQFAVRATHFHSEVGPVSQ